MSRIGRTGESQVPAAGGGTSERLTQLKARSGRSYEWLARQTYTSKSSLQRYCAGTATPPTFGVVERIALACGASDSEVAELFRVWNRERAESTRVPAPAEPDSGAQEVPEPGGGSCVGEPREGGRSEGEPREGERSEEEPREGPGVPIPGSSQYPAPGRRGSRRRWSALGMVAVMVAIAVLLTRGSEASWWAGPAGTRRAGPVTTASVTSSWTGQPVTVPPSFFGVTLNSSTGAMPGFRVGAVRLWDSETRWAQLEPSRGRFDWAVLDRLVGGAEKARLPALFTFGGTPRWANPDAPGAAYPDGSRAAPPSDLTDWDSIVRAVAQRYAGRIEAYELWPLGNDPRFFNGSTATLAEMTRRAARILRSVDPAATVVCPGMGNLWTSDGQTLLRRFAEAGGYDHCDVASIKLYQRQAGDPPETMLALTTSVDRLLHAAGVQPRIWVTGTTYGISEQAPLDPALARAYATRYYLTGLYARPLNLTRMYFYSWGGSRLPLVLQAEGSAPTPAALAVDRLQRWLAGAGSTSCRHGTAAGLAGNVWECRFVLPGGRPRALSVLWTETGTAEMRAGPQDVLVRDLDDRTRTLRAGEPVPLTQEPVLVERTG